MITQYQFELDAGPNARPRAEWAYRLYAALLEQAPGGFADALHADRVSPISQFVLPGVTPRWCVTLLGQQTEQALAPLLDAAGTLYLERPQAAVTLRPAGKQSVPDLDALFARAAAGGRWHTLRFCTPTAYKSGGHYRILPSVQLILQSAVRQWNGCFPACPIEDEDGQGLDAMARGLVCRALDLHNDAYRLKGQNVPGFTGRLCLQNQLTGFHAQLADALLYFTGFAGSGIKTTLGMGGVLHQKGPAQGR